MKELQWGFLMNFNLPRHEYRGYYSEIEEKVKPPEFPADPGNIGVVEGWASPSFDEARWETMELPGSWISKGLQFNGVLWFRKSVEIPSSWNGKDLALNIGAVDKTDITYFNGEQVGATGEGIDHKSYTILRRYAIPHRLVKAGRAVVAVRAYSFAYNGGLTGPAEAMYIACGKERIPLAGQWRYAIERKFPERPEQPRPPLSQELDSQAAEYPDADVHQLKALQYKVIAEGFTPKVFFNSPFYFEAGINGGWEKQLNPGQWLLQRNMHLFRDVNPKEFEVWMERQRQHYYLSCGPYVDLLHNCPTFTSVLKYGFAGIYDLAGKALNSSKGKEESDFIKCAREGLLAAKRVSERFAETAESLLKDAKDERQRRNLKLVAKTAREVPWRKPETFYEGLNSLWFVREVQGLLEGLETNSLGRPDAMLLPLYENDLKAGRLTQDEAYELICLFLLAADCHYDQYSKVAINTAGTAGHEFEITLTLGGCDENGQEVFNDITRMFLRAYRELKLIYPKPHCRYSKKSNPEYLELLNREILAGHCIYSLVNDDCVIQALVKDGKNMEDARDYLCSGCWDIVVDSREDMSSGNYFSLAKVLEMSIHCDEDAMAKTKLPLEKLDGAKSFEEVYGRLLGNLVKTLQEYLSMKGRNGKAWTRVNPSPFYSACLYDCLERRKDFTAGGGRYNPHSMSLLFFANVVDSLLAIKTLCFGNGQHALPEFLNAVRMNWKGYEALRMEASNAPFFGDNSVESNSMARRLHEELYASTRGFENERGGKFEMGYWSYRDFLFWGEAMKATPDGRMEGDCLAQSLNPSRLHHIDQITSTLNSIASLDLTKCAADSVVNLVLPANGTSLPLLDQLERVAASLNLQLLQLNCVNKDDLLDAKTHPERHRDLIVRVCGFSARFTSLPPAWQDEFINRNIYGRTA